MPESDAVSEDPAVNDFYFGSKEWDYPMGHISFVGKLDGEALAGAPAIAPGLTLDLMANHSLDFWLTSEDLPDPNNRVTLDRDGKSCCSTGRTTRRPQTADREAQELDAAANEVRGSWARLPPGLFSRNLFLGHRIPLAGVAHQNGTIRFGEDPQHLGAGRQLQGA